MDKNIIRAYLWEDIIRLGFSPKDTKNQKSWLYLYGQSLKGFWEVDYPKPPVVVKDRLTATIDSSKSVGMIYEYSIGDALKFNVRLMHAPPRKSGEIMWGHDMDDKYFYFPNQFFLTNYVSPNASTKARNIAIQNMGVDDIGAVVDSLIIHPTPHQHIDSPLDNHEIRIGGGLMNPFLYLFHLRVQLCPDKDMRAAERERLISLFEAAIRENSAIKPNDLMQIPN